MEKKIIELLEKTLQTVNSVNKKVEKLLNCSGPQSSSPNYIEAEWPERAPNLPIDNDANVLDQLKKLDELCTEKKFKNILVRKSIT